MTPLHYLPQIIQDGSLYPKSVLASRGIRPRVTAARRDRMLGLADYIHLSMTAQTPLLADKLKRGYPHVLLIFPRAAILALPGVALMPYNTKAWRAKATFALVTDSNTQHELLAAHDSGKQFPSLEALVHYGLGLELLTEIAFINAQERNLITSLFDTLNFVPSAPMTVQPDHFGFAGDYQPVTLTQITDYFDECRTANRVLTPPEIAFD